MQVKRTPPHRPPPAGRVATDAEAEHGALDADAAAPPKSRARARAAAARPAPVAAQPAAPRARQARLSQSQSSSSAVSEAARFEAPAEMQLALSIVEMGEALVAAAAAHPQAGKTHIQGQRARNARLAAQAFVDDATLTGHPVADALQAR